MVRVHLFLSTLLVFIAANISAQTKKWDGGASTQNWSDAANWEPNGVPASTDNVVLDNQYVSGSYIVNLPNSVVTIRSLDIKPTNPSSQITVEIPTVTPASSAIGRLILNGTGFNTLSIRNRGRLNNRHGGTALFRSIQINDSTNFGMLLDTGAYYLHNTLTRDLQFLYKLNARYNSTFEYQRNVSGTDNNFMIFPVTVGTYPGLTQIKFYNLILSGSTSPSFLPDYAVTPARNWDLYIDGDLTIRNNACLGLHRGGSGQDNRSVYIKGNINITSTTNTSWVSTIAPLALAWRVFFNGTTQQTITGDVDFMDRVEINNVNGVSVSNTMNISSNMFAFYTSTIPSIVFTQGKITTNPTSGLVSINVTTPASIFGQNNSNYINGKLRRSVTGTGSYDFPIGTATDYQFANITLASVVGVSNITTQFLTSNIGNIPTPLTESGNGYTYIVNSGYWRVTPNAAMTAGNFGVTLNTRGYSNGGSQYYTVVRRVNESNPWTLQGTAITNSETGGTIAAQRNNFTSTFTDFSIAGRFNPITWTGATNSSWNTASNWSPAVVPAAADNIVIPDEANDPVLSTGSNGTFKNITINNGATISVASGYTLDVKGNWTGANNIISGAGKVIFSGTTAQTISGGAAFTTLQVNNTAGATIAVGPNTVDITTSLELKGGQLITNGNLKTISTTTGTSYINDFSSGFTGSLSGLVSVERFIPPSPNGFRYIGQPVNTGAGVMAISAMQGFTVTGVPGQTIPLPTCSPTFTPLNIASNSPYGNLMYFQENGPYGSPACRQRGWWYQTTGNLTVGRGYGIKQGGNTKITYRGTANTGTITSSATNTHTSVFSPAGNNGWNLVSNPYPSAITIDEMGTNTNTANDMPAGFDKQIQFYITGNTNLTGSYQTYNVAISGAANIALGQGFWVRVTTPGTTPAWTLGQGHRTTSSPTYFDVNPQIESHLKVNVSGNGFADLSNIYFVNGAESGLDIYDGNKWSSATGQPTLYTKAGEEVMGINSLPSLSETMVVPMGLTPGANGNFTFTFEDIASFPQTAMIYLEDLKLGTMNNLRDNATYEFAANLNDNPDRFMLHFQPGVAANVTNQNCDEAGAIEFIQQAPTVWASYTVKDNNGQVYAQGSNFTGSLTVSNLIPQEYILTLTHSSGYVAQEFITVNGTNPINATIEASATHVLVNETVSFVVTTNNATEYVWNFGDGVIEVSTNTTATHTYENNGIYNVVLTASNDECSTVATKVINVDNTTGIDGAQTQGVKIYGYGHHLVVEFDNWLNDKADVFMYNTLGQRVETFTGISTLKGRQELNVTGIKPGYYFIQVVSNGKVIGKKIFLDSF